MPKPFHRAMRGGVAALLLAACAQSSFAKSELEAMDDRIVQAYNAEPKRTAEVYSLCLDMIDLANDKKSGSSDAWIEKARKLLSLSCLCEAVAAQRRGDFKQVYVWCGRGLASGAAKGEIGGLDLAEIAVMLSNLQDAAKRSLDASGESYGSLGAQFRPPSRSEARCLQSGDALPDEEAASKPAAQASGSSLAGPLLDVKGGGASMPAKAGQGRLREGSGGGVSVIDGPRQDRDGSLFIKIKTPAGRDAEIVYVKGKGWAGKDSLSPVYFDSWMKCAEDLVRGESK